MRIVRRGYILEVYEWETPASKYPVKRFGRARISRAKYDKGLYLMEGVGGFAFFKVMNPIKITVLKIGRRDVMVDDPLHWFGMSILANCCRGKTLIGGLGLGLIIHALQSNKDVESIDVYEIDGDVIQLIQPLLPNDNRVKVIHDDVFNSNPEVYDTIVLDLWAGRGNSDMGVEMLHAYSWFRDRSKKANVYVWGLTNPRINPSVEPKARRVMMKMISEMFGFRNHNSRDVGEGK